MSIKKKVMAVEDRDKSKATKHIVIEWDRDCPDPLHDYDQVFLLHSNVPRAFCGNEGDKDYEDPLVEIEDEDGYGTGEFRFRDGVVAFPVSAYIHSGIALSLGTTREFPCDPGGWDTTPNAAYMWTDRERFEEVCRPWMELYDEKAKTCRKAKDEAEFRQYLRDVARSELETLQKCLDGECFYWREEIRRPYKKVWPDGTEEDCSDWEDGDSYGGYYVDSIDDFEFDVDEDTDVFDNTGHFVGDTWTIPELVILHPDKKLYLRAEAEKMESGTYAPAIWTTDLSAAKVFRYRGSAFNARVDGDKRLWDAFGNDKAEGAIKDKDELKQGEDNEQD